MVTVAQLIEQLTVKQEDVCSNAKSAKNLSIYLNKELHQKVNNNNNKKSSNSLGFGRWPQAKMGRPEWNPHRPTKARSDIPPHI